MLYEANLLCPHSTLEARFMKYLKSQRIMFEGKVYGVCTLCGQFYLMVESWLIFMPYGHKSYLSFLRQVIVRG